MPLWMPLRLSSITLLPASRVSLLATRERRRGIQRPLYAPALAACRLKATSAQRPEDLNGGQRLPSQTPTIDTCQCQEGGRAGAHDCREQRELCRRRPKGIRAHVQPAAGRTESHARAARTREREQDTLGRNAPAAEHGEQWVSGRVSHSPLAAHGHELARVATEYPHGPCARVYEQCHASDERRHRRVSATRAAHR